MALKNKQPKSVKLTWIQSAFESGKHRGPIWGAKDGDDFLLIVPVYGAKKGTSQRPIRYYELWREGIVHDEAKSKTLAEAQAFAERTLTEARSIPKAA